MDAQHPIGVKEPIAAGATGFYQGELRSKGRALVIFNKSLTAVTTDWDGTPVVLQIKGKCIESR